MSYIGVELESTIQVACNQIMRELGIPFLHLEKGSGNKGRIHRKGFPDLVFWYRGKSYAVELKTANGILKTEQEEWLSRLKKQGVVCNVCRSADDFIEFLKENEIIN